MLGSVVASRVLCARSAKCAGRGRCCPGSSWKEIHSPLSLSLSASLPPSLPPSSSLDTRDGPWRPTTCTAADLSRGWVVHLMSLHLRFPLVKHMRLRRRAPTFFVMSVAVGSVAQESTSSLKRWVWNGSSRARSFVTRLHGARR